MTEVKINWDCADAPHACCKGRGRHDKHTQRVYRTDIRGKEVVLLCADQIAHAREYGWSTHPLTLHECACPQCGLMH